MYIELEMKARKAKDFISFDRMKKMKEKTFPVIMSNGSNNEDPFIWSVVCHAAYLHLFTHPHGITPRALEHTI